MKFVLASHNQGKLAEMQRILGQLGVEVVLQSEWGWRWSRRKPAPPSRKTPASRPRPSCRPAACPPLPTTPACAWTPLNGAPGVYSARYGGLDDDVARYRLLLENLRGAGTRAAHFHTSVVCCFPNGNVLEAEGDCHGTIAYAPQGGRTALAMTRCSSCRS